MPLSWPDIVLLSVTGVIVLWALVFGVLWFREWWMHDRRRTKGPR